MSPGGSTGISWVVGAFAVSVVGHAATYAVMPSGSSASSRDRPQVEQLELFIEVPPSEPAAMVDERTATNSTHSRERRTTSPRVVPSPPIATEVANVDTRETPDRPVVPEVRRPIQLDASRAARSVLAVDGPRMPRAADTSHPDVESPTQRDARLAGALNGVLREAAAARPEGFGRRTLPTPVRRSDGTLAYPLGQVVAIVNVDGSFTFDDTSGVSFGGMGNAEREGMQTHWGLEEFMMRRRGDDPHAATRRWFAEQTESMRAELERAYIERQARAAARGMRGRLSRILGDSNRPIDMRRRTIFEQWDECAEGEIVADAVRDSIVAFVRERLPRGSAEAYSDGELDELNRGRTSVAEFRPYAP